MNFLDRQPEWRFYAALAVLSGVAIAIGGLIGVLG